MAFAAPSAMWLYCTGTVLEERARLLSTQKEQGKREIKPTVSEKSFDKKGTKDRKFRKIIKKERK